MASGQVHNRLSSHSPGVHDSYILPGFPIFHIQTKAGWVSDLGVKLIHLPPPTPFLILNECEATEENVIGL